MTSNLPPFLPLASAGPSPSSLLVLWLPGVQEPGGQDTTIRVRQQDGAPPPAGTQTQQPTPGGGGGGAPPDPSGACLQQLPLLAAIGLVFYFLLIRPQQKQEKLRREMLRKVTRGDRVVTSGGIHGVVAGITDDTVQLRLDSEGKVKITVDRTAIGRVLVDDAAKPAAPEKDGDKP